eukprot:GHVL01026374.1.p1 GENE.GHVL01026374.1~~GHVL01026374.1.p1  ORF type:complete len:317 (-),score=62.12 GHVL01026374.1:67-1017(-)
MGRHFGGLKLKKKYPVFGIRIRSLFGQYKPDGLFQWMRCLMYKPIFGTKRNLFISDKIKLKNMKNLLKTQNIYTNDIYIWPEGNSHVWKKQYLCHTLNKANSYISNNLYNENETKFFIPSIKCNYINKQNYITDMLESNTCNLNKSMSGINKNNVFLDTIERFQESKKSETVDSMNNEINERQKICIPSHLIECMNEKDIFTVKRLSSVSEDRFRVRKLWDICNESTFFRTKAEGQNELTQRGPFPYVREDASMVQHLPLSEILWYRHNHRVQIRKSPVWSEVAYHKRKDHIPYHRKLVQIRREEARKTLKPETTK